VGAADRGSGWVQRTLVFGAIARFHGGGGRRPLPTPASSPSAMSSCVLRVFVSSCLRRCDAVRPFRLRSSILRPHHDSRSHHKRARDQREGRGNRWIVVIVGDSAVVHPEVDHQRSDGGGRREPRGRPRRHRGREPSRRRKQEGSMPPRNREDDHKRDLAIRSSSASKSLAIRF
jgi:hypothetical protein